MISQAIEDKIYIGLVEDNADPKRLGRVRVRVQSIFKQIPTEHIPWAYPFKGLTGKDVKIPAIGKMVNVRFNHGNIYDPIYLYSQHYNKNLKRKLDSLDKDEYADFIAFNFDHKTQFYVDNKGLTMDYLYNQIHMDEENINLRLKDNTRNLNLGSTDADQEAVLGSNFFDWFDRLIDTLLQPTSLTGNLGAPVIKPQIDQLLAEYKSIKSTFKSKHVNIVNNNSVEKVQRDVETSPEEFDNEVKANDQDAFATDKQNTKNSNIVPDDVKKNIEQKTENERKKVCQSKPTKMAKIDEVEYHENDEDAPEQSPIKMVDENGNVTQSSYDELMNEDKVDNKQIAKNNAVNSEQDLEDGNLVENNNYGSYLTSNTVSNTEINAPVPTPESTPKKKSNGEPMTDENGNTIYDTVTIYENAQPVGEEEYVMVQNEPVVKKYYKPLKRMIDAAKNDGVYLRLNESYRSWDKQFRFRDENKNDDFNRDQLIKNSSVNYSPYTGRPGRSIHCRGSAFDFSTNGGTNKAYKWLVKNAIKFGFVRTVRSETWHWEYKPWEFNNNIQPDNMFAVVPEGHESWMGLNNETGLNENTSC